MISVYLFLNITYRKFFERLIDVNSHIRSETDVGEVFKNLHPHCFSKLEKLTGSK